MFTGRGEPNRRRVLEFIGAWIEKEGYPPSIREICKGVGLASTKAVKYHLDALVADGRLRRNARHARAIEPTTRINGLPLVGRIAAGQPILAVENIEDRVSMSQFQGCFMLRVKGDSMTGAGILDGDQVIVHPQTTARDGDIVAAMVDNEATVKRFQRAAGRVILRPENPQHAPISVGPASRDFRVLGRVVGLLRDYRA